MALVLALALMLSGCGGSGDERAEGSISEKRFLKQGTRICEQVFSKIDEEYRRLTLRPGVRTEREMNLGVQRFAPPAITVLVQRLRDLGAPAGEAHRFEQTLADLEAGVERAEEDAQAARGSGGADFAFEDGYEGLWAMGLTRCGLG